MVVYSEILNDNETLKLSALLDDSTGHYKGAFLTFLDNNGEEYECWDNPDYLYDNVYPFLKGEMKSDHKEFVTLTEDLHGYFDLLEMFQSADKLGFFEEFQEKPKKYRKKLDIVK